MSLGIPPPPFLVPGLSLTTFHIRPSAAMVLTYTASGCTQIPACLYDDPQKIPHDYGKFYPKIKTAGKRSFFSDLQSFIHMECLI